MIICNLYVAILLDVQHARRTQNAETMTANTGNMKIKFCQTRNTSGKPYDILKTGRQHDFHVVRLKAQ